MFCASCGCQNEEGRTACWQCGAGLGAAQPSPVPVSPGTQAYGQQGGLNQAPQQGGFGAGQQGGGSYSPQNQPAPQGSGYVPPAYQEGCVSAAWKDIKSTPGWFKKMLLLGLAQCVPILWFVVPGFALRWSRDLSFGKREPMPGSIFGEKAFSMGFFTAVVEAIFLIVFYFVGFFLGFIPIIGLVASFILGIFVQLFMNACIIRMAIVDRFGAAFSFSRVWTSYQRALGSLFGASVLPGLVVGLITFVIMVLALIIVCLVLGVSIVGLSSMGGYGYSYGSSMIATASIGALIGVLFVLLLFGYFTAVSVAVYQTLLYRSLGHWAARVAPDWSQETFMGYPGMAPYSVQPGGNYGNSPYPNAMPQGGAIEPPHYTQPQQSSSQVVANSFANLDGVASGFNAAMRADDGCTALLSEVTPQLILIRSSGQRYEIKVFPATIGKGSAANVRIEDNGAISRVHARILNTGSSFVVEDLGATNKTYLNGEQLEEGGLAVMRDGDELRLGDEVFSIIIIEQ